MMAAVEADPLKRQEIRLEKKNFCNPDKNQMELFTLVFHMNGLMEFDCNFIRVQDVCSLYEGRFCVMRAMDTFRSATLL